MYVTPEQFTATGKAGVDAFVSFANTQWATLERLSALNLNATKSAFEDSVNYAKALLGAKDPQELLSLNSTAAQPALEKAIAYSRGVYEVATQTQGELAKFVETQTAEFNKNLMTNLDTFAKNAPGGSDVAVAAVKSALAAANSAYDSLTRVAKQASEYAESNFVAATSAAKDSRKKAA